MVTLTNHPSRLHWFNALEAILLVFSVLTSHCITSVSSSAPSVSQPKKRQFSHTIPLIRAGAFQPTTTTSSPHTNQRSMAPSPAKSNSALRESSSEKDKDSPQVSIGFLGCGTIASAIATGLATQTTSPVSISSIAVTKRSESKSTRLLESFPDLVTVFDNGMNGGNQNVVDSSDIVFLCVLPQQVDEVLKGLTFDSNRHTLVSLMVRLKFSKWSLSNFYS